MVSVTVEYRSVPGTAAALGRAGNHVVIADRPDGRAGGLGLGFNGAQLLALALALALGGCFCNDIHYTADEMGEAVDALEVVVTVELAGAPLVATDATMTAWCELASGADPAELIARSEQRCTIANTLKAGMNVRISPAAESSGG